MEFEGDVFISYAHIDDLPLKKGEEGWVSEFHHALEWNLTQLMGGRPQIWRDPKLQGNDVFGDEIVDQLHKTALLVSILSPGYIKSEWCTRELRAFCEAQSREAGIKIDNKCRIFKVIKLDVPYKTHPPEIADILGYKFYIKDPSGNVRELDLRTNGGLQQIYRERLNDVAHNMCELLGRIKKGIPIEDGTGEGVKVYLAETGHDLDTQRDTIRRELEESGCQVLPDRELPLSAVEFNRAAESFLDQCELSIHLVGKCYGTVPEGAEESMPVLQNELAVRKSRADKMQRLIWLQPGGVIEDRRQIEFVDRVRSDDEAQFGADMLETSIEEFKNAIQDKLKVLRATAGGITDKPAVFLAETNYYLKEQAEGIRDWLTGRGHRVLPDQPLAKVYEESVTQIDHMLEQCDLSIHLLGKEYGVVPDNTDKSIIRLQYERATRQREKKKLPRLTWIAPEINESDERQRSFIDGVRTEASVLPGDEIVDVALEEIKPLILKELDLIQESRKPEEGEEMTAAVDGPTESRQVYLICDRSDLRQIRPLEDLLYENGYDVILPAFEGEEAERLEDHRENLKSCAAVLVFYGSGGELWQRSVSRDLSKVPGYGRTRPLRLKGIYLAPPGTGAKERFRSHDTLVINGLAGFSAESMAPFIEILNTITESQA